MHRDLKPGNILIFSSGDLKLIDFGLAKGGRRSQVHETRREICTLWYRAPELLMGADTYTAKMDIWSAGIIVLEMLVGRCPTAGNVHDVCKCPRLTHFNYNGDQLRTIFCLLGTPRVAELSFVSHCRAHFQDWLEYTGRNKLEAIVFSSCRYL